MASRAGDVAKARAAAAARTAATTAVRNNPWVLAALAIVALLALLLIGVAIAAASTSQPPPVADTTTSDIPEGAVAAYLAASAAAADIAPGCSVRPAVLAGIGRVETGHGTFGGATADASGTVTPPIIGIALDGAGPVAAIADTDRGRIDGDRVWDRAVGPMQFIPSTWASLGRDGNDDGMADPHNLFDAAAAAVNLLCRPAVDLDADESALRAALYRYNHSDVYVSQVMSHIAAYDTLFAAPTDTTHVTLTGPTDPAVLTSHPNYTDTAIARRDLDGGIVDARLIAIMALLADHHPIHVGGYETGHYQCVGGGSIRQRPDCTESHHWHGRGADISTVDGRAVSPSNAAARELVELLAGMSWPDPTMRPEVGSPWPEFSGLPGFFSDADHQGHLHIGVCGPRWSRGVWGDSC